MINNEINLREFFLYNILAFVLLVSARVLSSPFDHLTPDIGNLLWFPIGAAILCYLLFGYRVFFGIFLGYLIAETIIEGGIFDISQKEILKRFASSIAPMVSIYLMRLFHLSKFFDDEKISISHVIFLVFFSAILSTLFKALLIENSLPGLDSYITTYLIGDILGGTIFIYLGIKIFSSGVYRLSK